MTDPIVSLHARALAQEAAGGAAGISAADMDVAFRGLHDTMHEAFRLRATTPAGALASLEWARHQFDVNHIDGPENNEWSDRFTLALLDGALEVMRGMVGVPMRKAPNLPDVEDAVLDLRCDLSVIEALLREVLPEDDAADRLGVARQKYHQVALIPDDARRAFLRAVDTLRVNMGTLSRVTGNGDMLA